MAWTPAELGSVIREFPTLKVVGSTRVSGSLAVCGAMLGGSLVLNPTEDHLSDPEIQATFLVDSFEVEIGCTRSEPYLKLLGSRVPDTALRYGKDLIDLHVYSDHTVCFAAPQQMAADCASGMTAVEFISRYALPFLYEQAYFERHKRWPWGELAHGFLGLLEWLGRTNRPTSGDIIRTILHLESSAEHAYRIIGNRARRHHECPCGSGKRLRECHPDVKPAIDTVRSWVAQGRAPRLRRLMWKHQHALQGVSGIYR